MMEITEEKKIFNSMESYVDDVESADFASKKVTDPIITKVLGEKECPVQNCQLRLAVPEMKRQLMDKQKDIRDLTEENENYRNALKDGVPMEEREQCLITAMKDQLVQVIDIKYQKLQVELSHKELELRKLQQYADQMTREKNEYLSTLEADKNLKEKYQKLKIMEEQTSRLIALQEDAQRRANKYEQKYQELVLKTDKLTEKFNEKVRQYQHTTEMIKQATMVMQGFKIEPAKSKPTANNERGVFGRIANVFGF